MRSAFQVCDLVQLVLYTCLTPFLLRIPDGSCATKRDDMKCQRTIFDLLSCLSPETEVAALIIGIRACIPETRILFIGVCLAEVDCFSCVES